MMKKVKNRIISILLIACLLLSMTVPSAFAEGTDTTVSDPKSYTFPETFDNGNASASKKDRLYDDVIDFPKNELEYLNRGTSNTEDATVKYAQLKSGLLMLNAGVVGQWMAIRIKGVDPAAGYNTVTVSVNGHNSGGKFDFYLLPGNTGNTDEAINAALSNPLAAATGIDGTSSKSKGILESSLTAESYVLVFRCAQAGMMQIREIVLSAESGKAPELGTVQAVTTANKITVGETVAIEAKAFMTNGSEAAGATFIYESLTADKASVNSSGVVTGLAAGNAQIKVTAQLSGKEVSTTVALQVIEPVIEEDSGVNKVYPFTADYEGRGGTRYGRLYDDVVDFPEDSWEYMNRGNSVEEHFQWARVLDGILSLNGNTIGQWFAIRIKDIDTTIGYNTLSLSVSANKSGGKFNVYLLPGNTGNDDASIEAAISNPIAVLNGVNGTVGGDVVFENLEPLTETNYVLMFHFVEFVNNSGGFIGFEKATLSVTTDNPVLCLVKGITSRNEVKIGDTLPIVAKAYMTNNTLAPGAAITYTSLTPETASVDTNGVVTGIAAGKAEIKITAVLDGKEVNRTVALDIVNNYSLKSFEISHKSATLDWYTKESLTVTASAKNTAGQAMTDGFTVTYASSDSSIATVDANGKITAVGYGSAVITVTVSGGASTLTDTIAITTSDSSGVKSAILELRNTIYVRGTAQATLRVVMVSGYESVVPAGQVTFTTSNSAIATVDASGLVIAKAKGSAVISAAATFMGHPVTAEATVTTLLGGKTEPTYYTYEKRENALRNIERYDWAKELRDTAVSNAAYYVENFEAYYDAIMYEGLARSRQLQLQSSSDIIKCQLCGCEVYSTYKNLRLDVVNHPWKVQCPNCEKYFPTNDFESLYKLGLDANGSFNYELAHQKNAELVAAGETGYLVNTLYPELGATWGVDDGYGFRVYKDGTYGVMGTTAEDYTVRLYKPLDPEFDLEKTALYIPYYAYDFWSDMFVIITTLSDAYLYTGDPQYAQAGAILLDGIADVYPSYDLLIYYASRNDFQVTDGNGGYGKIMGRINDCSTGQQLANACDALYPIIGDETVLSFLSAKKGTEYTKEALWQNWRNNILLEIFNAAKKGQLKGNFGQQHAAVAAAAIILAEEPETTQMIEWIYASNPTIDKNGNQSGGNLGSQLIDVVDRDGFGNEASPNYNASWIERMTDMANYLAMYQGEEKYNPYENPKFAQMVVAHASLVSADYFTVQIGDCGSTAGIGFQRAEGVTDVGFKYLKDTILGKQLADYIYTWTGGDLSALNYGIFDADPTSIQADVLAMVGDGKEQISELLPSYGFGILRDGQTGRVHTLRDVWMTFGIKASHAHADKLNLGMAAFGLNIVPELGYPTNTGTNARRSQWEFSTIAHNTVVVDQKSQDGNISFAGTDPYLFDDSDVVKVLGVDASDAYSTTDIYNRTVVMIKANEDVSYYVDFFRVLGGSNHTFSFHAQSHNVSAVEGLEMIAQVDADGNYVGSYAGADVPYGADPNPVNDPTKYPIGYTWLKNVRKDTSVGNSFAVDFEISDYKGALDNSEGIHLYMSQINNFNADEVAFAGGPVPARTNNTVIIDVTDTLDYVLVQREAAAGEKLDSLFTTLYEPYRNKRCLQSMVSVPVAVVSGTPNATDIAMAVKVTFENGRIDYVFYASNNEVTYRVNDLFNVCGYVGVYSMDSNGNELYRYVSDGGVIVDAINTESVYTGTVTGFSKDLVLDNNYIDVDLVLNSSALEKLVGRFIHVSNDGVQNAIYRITAAEAIEGGTRLYTGAITVIRGHIDVTNEKGGYIYNIAEGQSFEIPLAYLSTHTCSGGTPTCAAPAMCACGQYHGEKDPANHVDGTEIRKAVEATPTQPGYSGDTHCKGCGAMLKAGTETACNPATGDTTPVAVLVCIFVVSLAAISAVVLIDIRRKRI